MMKTCKVNPLKLNETRFEAEAHKKKVDMLSVTISLMVLVLVSHVTVVLMAVTLDTLRSLFSSTLSAQMEKSRLN